MATKKNMPPKIKQFLQNVGEKLSSKKSKNIPKELMPEYKKQVKEGAVKAAKVVVPMAAVTVAMFKGKKEDRLDRQSNRQASRADRKESRAMKLESMGKTKRSEKLMGKASSLRTKSAANAKAAEIINKSKMK